MKKIVITNEVTINNIAYEKGTQLNVGDSLYSKLVADNKAKLSVSKKKKSK